MLNISSATPSFSRYVGFNERCIELLASPHSAPIILPNGKCFYDGEGEVSKERERAYGDIKVLLKVRDPKNIEFAGELSATSDDVEIVLAVNDKQMDSFLVLTSNGNLPSALVCYVKNAKTEDPNYKALNLRESSYLITDWDLRYKTIRN